MDLVCRYTNPAPSVVDSSGDSSQRIGVDGEGGQRLSRLEDNVAKLLDLMAGQSQARQTPTMNIPLMTTGSSTTSHLDHSRQLPHQTSYSRMLPPTYDTSGFTHDLNGASTGMDLGWLQDDSFNFLSIPTSTDQQSQPTSIPSHAHSDLSAGQTFTFRASGSNTTQIPPVSNMPELSPNAPSDTSKSRLSASGNRPHSEESPYTSAHARPIPITAAASRMAAFTDPSAHEAPFRSLTYNPDTYRNVEMSEDANRDDVSLTGATAGAQSEDGRGVVKYGRGDPVDRGIFTEAEARSLFAL